MKLFSCTFQLIFTTTAYDLDGGDEACVMTQLGWKLLMRDALGSLIALAAALLLVVTRS